PGSPLFPYTTLFRSPSFGGGGLTAGDSATDEIVSGLAIDGAGRAVVVGAAGRSGASADVLLARYLPDGRPDPAFAGGALAHVDLDRKSTRLNSSHDQ